MSRTKFQAKNLHKVSGLADEFDRLITAATADCLERPGVKQKRQVSIVVDLTPNPQDVEQVIVATCVKSKTPVRGAAPYLMNTTIKNELQFQPNSPMEPDQGELFDDEE